MRLTLWDSLLLLAAANLCYGADFQICRWLRFWRFYHCHIVAPFLQINQQKLVSKRKRAVISYHLNFS